MNLSEATQMMELRKQPRVTPEEKITASALTVAERVFEISAAFGEPYYANTPRGWARKWLASKKFILMEIAPHQVAVPNANRLDQEKVANTFRAAGSTEIEPIVVDMNKMGIGKTNGGYIPKIVVVDGKHRHRAQTSQGRDRIMAWVGELAVEEMQARSSKKIVARDMTISAGAETKMTSTAQLYAAVGTGMGSDNSSARQDTGDGGSRAGKAALPSGMSFEKVKAYGTSEGVSKEWDTRGRGKGEIPGGRRDKSSRASEIAKGDLVKDRTGNAHTVTKVWGDHIETTRGTNFKKHEVSKYRDAKTGERFDTHAQGAAGGSGAGSSGQNPERMGVYSESDPSDKDFGDDASDRGQMLDPSDKKQFSEGAQKDGNPTYQSPGSGVGPRLRPNTGASRSEFSQKKDLFSGPIRVKKIVTREKNKKKKA